MSCDKRFFDTESEHFELDDCAVCPGRDDAIRRVGSGSVSICCHSDKPTDEVSLDECEREKCVYGEGGICTKSTASSEQGECPFEDWFGANKENASLRAKLVKADKDLSDAQLTIEGLRRELADINFIKTEEEK